MAIGNTIVDKMINNYLLLNETVIFMNAVDKKTKDKIIEFIQQDQLTNKGIDATGKVIGYYSFTTEVASKGKKKQGAHYTLEDTRAFYDSMFVVVTGDAIVINANPRKLEDDLFQKYGSKIIGLTDENITKITKIIQASTISQTRDILLKR